jgi:hypothetical protein
MVEQNEHGLRRAGTVFVPFAVTTIGLSHYTGLVQSKCRPPFSQPLGARLQGLARSLEDAPSKCFNKGVMVGSDRHLHQCSLSFGMFVRCL